MKIGIVGRPHVGKTTVFNALAQSDAEIGGYAQKSKINLSAVSVPDTRLQQLQDVLEAKKATPTTIDYVDGGGSHSTASSITINKPKSTELDTAALAELRTVDSLAHVVRLFEDDSVPHIDGNVDPERDIETVNLEFTMSDLQIIEGRMIRLEKLLKNQKLPEHLSEFRILEQCKQSLENGVPLRNLSIPENDEKLIRGYGFLTQKPLLIICNIDENQLEDADELHKHYSKYSDEKTAVIVLAAQLEMEIGELEPDDAKVFMSEMGLIESALEKFIQTSYQLMGLITFFTAGPKEVRAWTLKSGQTAVEAAGRIHTDFQRGFVRSECIHWKDLVTYGSYTQSRTKGVLRVEGKTYQVQEGDVLTILANANN